MHVYERQIPARDQRIWEERVLHAGSPSTVLTQLDADTVFMAIYFEDETQALLFQAAFGGQLSSLAEDEGDDGTERLPADIGGSLLVIEHRDQERDTPLPALCVDVPSDIFPGPRHPTTLACLRVMAYLLENEKLSKGFRCLDVGCGCGILGIGAGLLGARSVVGVDCDRQAIETAQRNALRHDVRVSEWIVTSLEEFHPCAHYDLIVANLFADLLETSFHQLSTLLDQHGRLIVSGILHHFADRCLLHAGTAGLTVTRRWQNGPWITALLEKIPEREESGG